MGKSLILQKEKGKTNIKPIRNATNFEVLNWLLSEVLNNYNVRLDQESLILLVIMYKFERLLQFRKQVGWFLLAIEATAAPIEAQKWEMDLWIIK